MKVIVLVLVLTIFPPSLEAYTDESINLLVRSISSTRFRRYCIELAKLPNNRTVNVSHFDWHLPYLVDRSVNACDITNLQTLLPTSFPSKTMLLIYDHGCKMTEHAWNVEQQFGENISLMIITQRTNTRYSLTFNVTAMPVTIPTLVFWEKDFDRLIKSSNNLSQVEFSIDYPPRITRKFHPESLLMFFLVFLVLLAGNFWAADEFKDRIREHHAIQSENAASSPAVITQNSVRPLGSAEAKEPAVIPVTYCVIVFLLAFAVAWLLLIYYFPKVMIYILQGMFCLGAFSSLSTCFNRLSKLFPSSRRCRIPAHVCHRPCTCQLGPVNLATLLSMAIAVTLVVIWYVYRHEDWSWVLQDILGAAICITIASVYRLGNMRVITFILLGFFLYDIFFVFITPHIPIFQLKPSTTPAPTNTTGLVPSSPSGSTSSSSQKPARNPSVMEQVALGIGTNGEVVPLLFALPMFIPPEESDPCLAMRKSMLGFGDVILPGILLTFCKLFDIASGNRWPVYYIQSMISYFIGLGLTHLALALMNTAQPALLYLVPCLLISTILTGLFRGELKELYTGRRIQSLLDGNGQRLSSSLLRGIDNPLGAATHDEVSPGDTMFNGKDINP